MTTNLSGRDLQDEVTPYPLYLNRRRFLKGLGAVGTLAASAAAYRWFNPVRKTQLETATISDLATAELTKDQRLERGFLVDETMTSESSIISYNNFYEFSTDKNAVAEAAKNFDTTGWQIRVEGLVNKPRTFTIPDLKAIGPIEERIYRMRCVEAWSMVIPWAGLQLSHLIDAVEPMPGAKYVAFETLYDPDRMPGQKTAVLEWPLRRRPSTRRSHASTDVACRWTLWQRTARPRWSTGSNGNALEVWIQRDQVDRQNHAAFR